MADTDEVPHFLHCRILMTHLPVLLDTFLFMHSDTLYGSPEIRKASNAPSWSNDGFTNRTIWSFYHRRWWIASGSGTTGCEHLTRLVMPNIRNLQAGTRYFLPEVCEWKQTIQRWRPIYVNEGKKQATTHEYLANKCIKKKARHNEQKKTFKFREQALQQSYY